MANALSLGALEIYTLGGLRLALNGEPLSGFVSQKAEVLLVYLACNPRAHPREALAATFWGDTSAEQALKNLRTVLASLREQLAEALIVERQIVGINPDARVWLDSREVERAIQEFRRYTADHRKPTRGALRDLSAALAHVRGDFLPGFYPDNAPELESWASLERDRLRRLTVEALGGLIEQYTAWGDFAAALDHTDRLLKFDPLNEAGCRHLLRLLTFTGERSAALRRFAAFRDALRAELDVEPEVETLALLEQIKAGRLRAPLVTPAEFRVPHLAAGGVDRPVEQGLIAAGLRAPDMRLLTLAGIGGAGKTYLALGAAHAVRDEYQHGVYFVSLAPVNSTDELAGRIISALPIAEKRRSGRDDLLDYLRDRQLLLVLDNFEHLLDAAPLVGEMLRVAPDVKILTTSREPLRLRDETVIRVDGLSLPPLRDDLPITEDAEFFEAVRLFELVARRVDARFSLDAHLEAVVQLCHLVDGLPLGIEIAAAHAAALPPEAIAERLLRLAGAHRDAPQRHQGLGALLDDIWGYLSPTEARALAWLSIFPGSFDLDAAAHVISEGDDSAVERVARLVDKSLLGRRGERYLLHQIVRHYALDRLAEFGDLDAAQVAHAAYYRGWLRALLAQHIPFHLSNTAIDAEYPNLWAAGSIGTVDERLEILTAISERWVARGYHRDAGIELLRALSESPAAGERWRALALCRLGALLLNISEIPAARDALERCLRAGIEHQPRDHALALNTLAQICAQVGEYEQARDYAERILRIYDEADDPDDPAMQLTLLLATSLLGYLHLEVGDYPTAGDYCARAAAMAQEQGELRDLVSIRNNQGVIALKEDRDAEAYQHYSDALALAREIDHRMYITVLSSNLASAAVSLDKYSEAYLLTQEAIEMAHRIGYRLVLVYALDNFVTIAKGCKRFEVAATLFGATDRLREEIDAPVVARDRDYYQGRWDSLRDSLGAPAFDSAYEAGLAMNVEVAARYAMHHLYDV